MTTMKELEGLDREALMGRMAAALPRMRETFSLRPEDIERATHIRARRITAIEEGRSTLKWNEYLSLAFILWADKEGRIFLEKERLFPPELKEAFSVDRTRHEVA